jgi:transposase-like protein
MVYEAVICPHCHQPEAVYRPGHTADGRQGYRCTACRRRFHLHYQHTGSEAGIADKIEELALNGSGIRDTARGLGIRPQTVLAQLKKRANS